MPFALPSGLTTNQPFIPLADKGGINRIPGVSLHLPDLTSVTAASAAYLTANGVSGFASTGAAQDGLFTAVAVEKVNISLGFPVWVSGQHLRNPSETGVTRTWVLGTGGTDAANAAASHAKTVTIRPGLLLVLLADTNVVLFGTDIPAPGLGANGDAYVDFAGNYYSKSAGAWTSLGVVYAAGGNLAPVTVAVANQTANTTLTAATTVDVVAVRYINLAQTTAGITITIPPLTAAATNIIIAFSNTGTAPVTVAGADTFALNAGETREWIWAGTAWKLMAVKLTTIQTAATQALLSRGGVSWGASRASLPVWTAALKRVARGTGRARLLVAGDSTVAGAGGNASTSLWTGAWNKSWSFRLAAALSVRGIPTSTDSITTSQNISTGTYPAFDPRVALSGTTLPAPLSAGATGNGLGGASLWQIAYGTGNGKLAFTPTSQWDTAFVYTPRTPSLSGTLTWDVDGGSTGSLLQTGANLLVLSNGGVLSPALGIHTLNFTNVTPSTTAFLSAAICYDSTKPAVDVINAGCSSLLVGSTTIGLARNDSPYASSSAIGYIAPDLTIICCTINDANAATNPATYASAMQIVITTAKVSGDVILMAGCESSPIINSSNNRALILAQLQALAVTNNCVYISSDDYFGGWTLNDAAGLMYDDKHCTGAGYQAVANMLVAAL